MNEKIPYRADQVGSLLRPAKLKTARMEYGQGAISGDELHRIEDQCIRDIVAKQEATGSCGITDGEFHLAWKELTG